MQPSDKVEQLKQSIKARQEAEARREEAKDQTLSPGLEDQYKNRIAELEGLLEQARTECEEFKQQAQEHQDKFLRGYAEFENYRKRATREKEDISRYSSEKILKELLPALDGLEKAIEHADESADLKALVDGVELVLKQFLQTLEKFGLAPLEAEGQAFDPNLHEAMAHHESEEHKPNTVVKEYRRGYKLHDRLLRPALVTVAKSPDKEKT